ncbi:M16 family metallopeptidase [Pseudofrancisella aestuarii]|uniref:M16 family metallopeptidase n=1 Tax=Pseudofrancisella aestuarii TaxID=2670347 RepID=A0ABV9TD97_9GAMM|nr:pitrilysin family protein [Pseudofrancisella aestuarii]
MLQKWIINKTPVYFEQTSSLPIIDIQINFKAGSIYDNEKVGLSDLAVGLFATETHISSEDELINKTTDIGICIDAHANKEFFSIKIRLLSDPEIIQKTIDILKEIFLEPKFSTKILEREKAQTITHINYVQQQSNYLASLEFSKLLFKDNPYAQPTLGYKETVEKIAIKDIKSFFQKYICTSNMNLCIVGNINDTEANKLSEEIISALPEGQKNTQSFIQKPVKKELLKKQFQSKQTTILMGHQLLIPIDSPLYFPLKVGNEILGGGGLNSKLFNKVREELGLVYHVGSSLNISPDYGSFIISAQTSNYKLALDTINDVYLDFINNEIDKETLQNTKNHIEGTHLIGSVKNSSKLNMLSTIANKELTLDFFKTYVDKVNLVNSKDIYNAFKQVQENEMITVMVGDFSEN